MYETIIYTDSLSVPLVQNSPMNISVPINTEATFTCVVNAGAGSTVDITWMGPVMSLPSPINTPDDNFVTSNLTVNITSFTTFVGEYSCTASYSNCNGNITSSAAYFTVLLPPSVTQGPLDQVVDENDTIILNCTATNLGTVSISWIGPTPNLQGEVTMEDEMITSSLTLSEVNYLDGGVYTCTATNEAGSNDTISTLYVRPIVTPPLVLTSNVSSEVTLTCRVQDNPPATFMWGKMNSGGGYETVLDESERNLTFSPVVFGNEGSYRCVVNTAQFGEQISTSIALITGKKCVCESLY